ncbi:hypothetical protein [Arthrobacter sp. SLBN-53]|uniref:hypothetical protein n=1 Tax=Arthrobacter sp. SLBN-53 TaxID=2768412 RepID=UPI001150AD28|nr:hypothetical protein [Arthrobacter sp. SLBN-53]TQK29383.1 hypothetical protein FBY28_2386 [Arthrobacter sp. SLBN-53]
MAKFRANKGYHFSKDGTEATTWAKFEKVPGSDPVVYEYETTKASSVTALRKLIDGDVEGYADITEVEEKPKRTAGGQTGGAQSAGAQTAGKDTSPTPGADAGTGTAGAGTADGGQAAAGAGKDATGAQSSS